MKNSIAVVALALSLVSLGFQAHNAKPAARFDKFMGPASISEFDYRVMTANQEMIQNSMILQEGMAAPFVYKVTDDHQRLIVRVDVSEKDLPSGYDERKKALLLKATMAVGVVIAQFDSATRDAVSVEFMTFDQIVKGDKKPYAEYVKGELTFH
jgi:hypothetical protein